MVCMKLLKKLIKEILYTFHPVWNDEYTKVNRYWVPLKRKHHYDLKIKEIDGYEVWLKGKKPFFVKK